MNCLLLGINAKIYALIFSALFLISLIVINILLKRLNNAIGVENE